jgi:hypothetical protein
MQILYQLLKHLKLSYAWNEPLFSLCVGLYWLKTHGSSSKSHCDSTLTFMNLLYIQIKQIKYKDVEAFKN